MDNGISRECAVAKEAPHPVINVVPPGPAAPTAIPTVVEPTRGQSLTKAGRPKGKTGPKPVATSYRMEMLNKFITGDIPHGELGRLDFIRVTQFTPQEKSYLVNHSCFKELYDAKIFDFFLDPTQTPTKEELKLLEIVGRRIGLSKPTTQLNVQVNNNRSSDDKKDSGNDPISIRVQR